MNGVITVKEALAKWESMSYLSMHQLSDIDSADGALKWLNVYPQDYDKVVNKLIDIGFDPMVIEYELRKQLCHK